MMFSIESAPAYAYTGGRVWKDEQPFVVMLHGAQNDHSVWILQSRYLAHHGFNVLALDLPGHGRSAGPTLNTVEAMAHWVNAVLKQFSISNAHLVGHSMGSLIAVELASTISPTNIRSLALLGSALPMPVSESLLSACANDEARAIEMINLWSHSGITHWPSSPGPGFSVFVQGLRLMQRQSPGVLAIDFNACNNYQPNMSNLNGIACPSLLLTGNRDQMTSVKAASTLQALLQAQSKQVRLEIIDDCGHALMAEQPNLVLNSLKKWLQSHV